MPIFLVNSVKKLIRLFKESTIVICKLGNAIFKGILGNHEPEPTSQSERALEKSTSKANVNES